MSATCKHCGSEITPEMVKARKRKRMENVSAGLLARQAEGLPIGRPKARDDEAIVKLRRQGMSIRAIAKELKCSAGSVQSALTAAEHVDGSNTK